MNNYREDIEKQIRDSISVKKDVLNSNVKTINDIINKIITAYKNNKKVIWFGNGGSAADAQHLACELVSKFKLERKPLRSLALTTNTSLLTAVSNDYNFENVFERQVEGLAEKGDILIGITTSGTSPNIIKALKKGKQIGTINIALIGEYGDKIRDYTDLLISIKSKDTPRIQESHIMIGHIICEIVEKKIFSKEN
jgi:D-sedoheptulose 7-phosphate isomerase